ncbi:MAG: hypothetical protein EBR40_10180 [Proteobacteria bacterium]|nr:hypothetical protein [Pseudomonadota bacterium]
MVSLSDKTQLEFNLDFSSKQLVIVQKGEVGVEVGRIAIPMDDLKKWGSKFKGLASFIPGLTSKHDKGD